MNAHNCKNHVTLIYGDLLQPSAHAEHQNYKHMSQIEERLCFILDLMVQEYIVTLTNSLCVL